MSNLYFPEELLINILTRLPVRSLLRFTAVSKSWYFFITSPAFISAHLHHSRSDESANSLLLLRSYGELRKIEKYAIIDDTDHQTLVGFSEHSSPVAVASPIRYLEEGCCYNGVVCLSYYLPNDSHSVTLWNPSIRKLMTLPPPTIRPAFRFESKLGFGASPHCVQEFKVLRVLYERKSELCNVPAVAEIYSLSTGLWRRISAIGVNYFMIDPIGPQTFVNGAVHWIGYKVLEDLSIHLSIAVIDMADELFSEIMLPHKLARPSNSHVHLVAVDECIAVAKYDGGDHGCSYELWIMKEYGVVDSWSMLHVLKLRRGVERMVGIRKNGEFLFSTKKNGLVSYCPNTEVVNELGIFGIIPSFYISKYLESLVLLQEQSCHIEGLSQEMTSMSI